MTTDGADRSFGAPRFDVVLRGYDRRQVDEHLSRLQRVVARMRGDIETARGQSVPLSPPTGSPTGPPTPPGVRPRPTPRPRLDTPTGRDVPDVVGTFTDRMQTILQAAEEEAAEIRAKARSAVRGEEEKLATMRASVRAEEEMARVTLANLLRQRDSVLADLTRVRGQLEALLSGPTARIALPTQDNASVAAARQDAGAGHPLPGTPAPPPADAVPDPAPDPEKPEVATSGDAPPPVESREKVAAAPPAEVPDAEAPDVDAPTDEAATGEAPTGEAATGEAATAGAPVVDAPPGVDDTVEVGAVARPAEDGDPTNAERDPVSNAR